MTKRLLMGNEAIALAAILAGVNVACGYPGTPSTEIIETIAKHNPGDIHVEWSTNEKVALEVAAGASYAGARTLVTAKQVGLNVALDPLMSFNYVGCEGGTVLVIADDPGPISSQTEQDTRDLGRFAYVPVLDPASPEEAFAMIPLAFELSERYRTPVIVRPTTRINHGCSTIEVPDDLEASRITREIPGFTKDSKFVIFPRRSYLGHLEVLERTEKIVDDFSGDEFAPFNTVTHYQDFTRVDFDAGVDQSDIARDFVFLTSGNNGGYTHEAINMLQERARAYAKNGQALTIPSFKVMEVGTPVPFPAPLMLRLLDGAKHVLCIEELSPLLEREVLGLAGRHHLELEVHGKLDGYGQLAGENNALRVAEDIATLLGLPELKHASASEELPVPLPVRPPTLCAGCPHRAAFTAIKDIIGRKTPVVYSGDIGCYTLGNAAPLNTTDTCLCMGAGITVAQGLSIVEPDVTHIAFVGDSTFFASGLTGVANAVYNQHHLMIVVLDNATTAMTGNQPHPGTGVTLMGKASKPLSIKRVLEALGVTTIETADPLDRDAAHKAVSTALADPDVSAVIFESPCVTLFKPLEPVVVDPDTCTGCHQCISKLGCPALLHDNNKTHIDTRLCNGCDLCVSVCPFGAISTPREGVPPEERDAMRTGGSYAK